MCMEDAQDRAQSVSAGLRPHSVSFGYATFYCFAIILGTHHVNVTAVLYIITIVIDHLSQALYAACRHVQPYPGESAALNAQPSSPVSSGLDPILRRFALHLQVGTIKNTAFTPDIIQVLTQPRHLARRRHLHFTDNSTDFHLAVTRPSVTLVFTSTRNERSSGCHKITSQSSDCEHLGGMRRCLGCCACRPRRRGTAERESGGCRPGTRTTGRLTMYSPSDDISAARLSSPRSLSRQH
jgi:hypothetical protein